MIQCRYILIKSLMLYLHMYIECDWLKDYQIDLYGETIGTFTRRERS